MPFIDLDFFNLTVILAGGDETFGQEAIYIFDQILAEEMGYA